MTLSSMNISDLQHFAASGEYVCKPEEISIQNEQMYLHMQYHNGTETTLFEGACVGNYFFRHLIGDYYGILRNTLIQAINNRTRERNYFRLYSELLEDSISEEQFEKELKDNPDEYIIKLDHHPTQEEIQIALNASEDIKDLSSLEDLQTLFSFAPEQVKQLLIQ